jgi:hypothetical protein
LGFSRASAYKIILPVRPAQKQNFYREVEEVDEVEEVFIQKVFSLTFPPLFDFSGFAVHFSVWSCGFDLEDEKFICAGARV